MWEMMRNHDRSLNGDQWPQLYFPNAYVLEGGYAKFFPNYPELCEGSYEPEDLGNHQVFGASFKKS
jgi:hypothetical protein